MQKKILLGAFLSFSTTLKAQNTFPSQGNVGIGTVNPTSSLHISKRGNQNGDIKLDDGRIVIGNVTDESIDGIYRTKILTDGPFRMKTTDYAYLLSTTNRFALQSVYGVSYG